MRGFGFALIGIAIAGGLGFSLIPKASKALVGGIAGLAILAGITLVFSDRITEVTISGVGSIKAARIQSEEDALAIADIRDDLESLASENESLKEASGKAAALLAELEGISGFQSTVLAADSDSRIAWDQLYTWAEDLDYPYHSEATEAWKRIARDHSQAFFSSGFQVPWKEGLNPATLTLDDLLVIYGEAPVDLRPALIEFISKREDIPRKERMSFMIDIITKDSSIRALEYAARHFFQAADLKMGPMNVPAILQWWSENAAQIQD